MYRVLSPNGQWTIGDGKNGPCLNTEEDAKEFARRIARIMSDDRKFLIFKDHDTKPCASTQLIYSVAGGEEN